MIEVKPAERPPFKRYVIRNAQGFYYDGHGYGPTMDTGGNFYEPVGEAGVPGFNTRNILFAIKYGDTESIEQLIKNHKKWCIDRDRNELFGLFDTCDVLETYT
jgi:hypothetical protein